MTYTEDALVEQPAIQLFSELGWETVTCWDEVFGSVSDLDNDESSLNEKLNNPLFFGRETRNDVILFTRLKAALLTLNPDVNPLCNGLMKLEGFLAYNSKIIRSQICQRKKQTNLVLR